MTILVDYKYLTNFLRTMFRVSSFLTSPLYIYFQSLSLKNIILFFISTELLILLPESPHDHQIEFFAGTIYYYHIYWLPCLAKYHVLPITIHLGFLYQAAKYLG
jgi:hypothetical protein